MSFVGGRTTLVIPDASRIRVPLQREIRIKTEDSQSFSVTRQSEPHSLRSSPDSSTADEYLTESGATNLSKPGFRPFRCPQPHCTVFCIDEQSLSDHLIRGHRSRLIKSEPSASITTRCPVCRLQVTDLSHHFAMDHSERKAINLNNNNNNNYRDEKPILVNGSVSSSSYIQANEHQKVILLPNQPVPEAQLRARSMSGEDDRVSPMNLSVRRSTIDQDPPLAACNNNNNNSLVLPYTSNGRSGTDSEDHNSNFSEEYQSSSSAKAAEDARKRRKQTHVPDASKDDKYWARRMKNNEAAKRSRDMRIRREKIVFEENSKLEQDNKDMRMELDRVITENKELHLKLGLILDENARLKDLLYTMQQQNNNTEDLI